MKLTLAIILVLSIATFTSATENISCRNQQGEAVDWWIMFKLPNDYNKGRQYIYFDDRDNGENYTMHPDINIDSPVLNTIEQIREVTYADKFAVFWNDQLPNGKKNASSGFAHAKGAAGGNTEGGFVINHTLPRFFYYDDEGNVALHIPDNQTKYGQHLFCISMDAETLNEYGHSLIVDRVYAMDNGNVPESLSEIYNNYINVLDNKYKIKGIPHVTQDLTSIGGNAFKKFAKHKDWKDDLYREVVAYEYDSDFIYETWGRSLQGPDCNSKYQILSNLYVKFTDDIQYSYTKDHSKFGISSSVDGIVCFGDLNRMTSQYKRGGGTTCFYNESIHAFLKNAFVTQQDCDAEQEEVVVEKLTEEFESLEIQDAIVLPTGESVEEFEAKIQPKYESIFDKIKKLFQ